MALTTLPAAGAKLRGSVLSALFTEVRPVPAYKSADETISSNGTLQNDDALAIALVANAQYDFELRFNYSSGTTPDFYFGWTFPTGMTMFANLLAVINGGAGVDTLTPIIQTSQPNLEGSGGDRSAHVWGKLLTGTTAGTLQFQWAQLASTASNTIVRAGSYLTARRTS